jgi:hypothetical protein
VPSSETGRLEAANDSVFAIAALVDRSAFYLPGVTLLLDRS